MDITEMQEEIERLRDNLDLSRMEYAEYREVSANESDAREAEIKHLRFIVKMLLHYIDTGDMRELDLRIARTAIAPTEDK